ncbi:MAG: flagellar hook-associated protein FlgL [Proteobacteria bacterium]|nr:flagellar hook-associated protein FlgL [Pseudomonadota bacterium]
MAINNVLINPNMSLLSTMRTQLEDMQRQLGTGQKADTYGTLGAGRTQSITFRSKISEINGYLQNTDVLNMRISLLDKAMGRLEDIPSDAAASIDPNTYNIDSSGTTTGQKGAKIALNEVIGLLNSEADGRYLMSGKTTDTKPVVSMDEMLYGSGSKYGLKKVINERYTADLGTNKLGRLDVGTATGAVANDTVTITRQGTPPSAEFGYKIASASASTSDTTHVSVTPTTGVDSAGKTVNTAYGIQFGANLQAGDSVSLELENPDGTKSTVKLTGTLTSPPGKGEFTIAQTGSPATVDIAATAANFKTRIEDSLKTETKTTFQAASMMRASETFFDTTSGGKPQRVDADPTDNNLLATATGLRDGDDTDTVEWYAGYNEAIDPNDSATSPRNDVVARVDSNITVGYGVRANEGAYADMVRSLAVMTVAEFDPKAGTLGDTNATTDAERQKNLEIEKSRHTALASRVDGVLAFASGNQKPTDIHTEIAVSGNVAKSAADRQTTSKSTLQVMLDGVEGINKEELTAQILTLQTRMEASYTTSMILNNLNLLNYMK